MDHGAIRQQLSSELGQLQPQLFVFLNKSQVLLLERSVCSLQPLYILVFSLSV
jgi:hypothetical protein